MPPLLEVKNLGVTFNQGNNSINAVKNVSFKLDKKKILGIVGESGSGKSITAKSIMGLLPDSPAPVISGEISFNNQNLTQFNSKAFQKIRGKDIAMIFQDPISSLNPRTTIGKQITEVILQHKKINKRQAKAMALDILQKVGIQDIERNFNAYPYEFSGGMRQRVMIAMALVLEPQILIADEPTTALDVSTQNQLLELMKDLYDYIDTSIIFITHDLGVVYQFCDEMIVMKQGEVVESGSVSSVFNNPTSAYTQKLINSVPNLLAPKTPRQISDEIILKFEDVSVEYPIGINDTFKAVKHIDLEIKKGESLGIVGESGSGKSSLAKTVVGLNSVSDGYVWYKDIPLSLFNSKEMQPLRKDIQMIFQDPFASINPRFKVIDIIGRPLKIHNLVTNEHHLKERVKELLLKVGLDEAFLYRFPHELSGGQRQRVSIARAIAINPKIIVCDEAVSALDVSVQKEIIQLLKSIQDEMEITYIFITHDMGVIKEMCDRIAVMQNGNIVELNDAESIIEHPQAPYTQKLISEVPTIPN
ncbi:ABC transporter ATP-binding protein [Staphylococcus gallinarum]|jgi:peptide/nickel transport system ATP-binding protein|uniref:dipeptide ABC transporter ATP-binding protein n=1 Tax=Staphylococcus gallinarum TaxID=1293 RepID=UPI000E698AF7|nr:ABC transporter ATP-binding protein [Staphylococcus gallinarum]MCQ9289626.1 ABC transporter ATP-binding protein [Staphylococcus gallinarum]MEB6242896.1 ABC transporter ATP-binding protein [Staphylococcus gallinarum]MEB6297000.1 ABC transporter ATP-binding protein [Staphylococcus gallinarum]RIP08338.1 ABC transporter ATP-binding protein [Staphylococcus gallinarum]